MLRKVVSAHTTLPSSVAHIAVVPRCLGAIAMLKTHQGERKVAPIGGTTLVCGTSELGSSTFAL